MLDRVNTCHELRSIDYLLFPLALSNPTVKRKGEERMGEKQGNLLYTDISKS